MGRRPLPRLRSLLAALALAQGVFLAVLGLRAAGFLERLELLAYDTYLAWRVAGGSPATEIVVVAITDDDVRDDTTIDDGTLATVLARLADRRPAAIGLDLLRHAPVPPGSEALAEVLRARPEIVVASGYGDAQQRGRAAPPAVEDPGRIGFADMDLDPDGVLRRGLLYLTGGEGTGTAFALRLALRFLDGRGIAPEPDGPHLRLGAATYVPLPADAGGYASLPGGGYQMLLSYPACAGGLPTVPVSEVVNGAPPEVAGRLVLVGSRVTDAKDVFKLPVDCAGASERQAYGVEVQAHILSQLVRQATGEARPLETPGQRLGSAALGRGAEATWLWLWVSAGALAAWRIRSPIRVGLTAAAGAFALIALTLAAFLRPGLWLPVVPPLLGGMVALGLAVGVLLAHETLRRARLMRLFSAYVSPGVATTLWREDDDDAGERAPAPRELTATVLFSDIRGSTTISEALPETELMGWLNEYMAVMADLVLAHGGSIEKFAGDGITAAFGVPEPRTREDEVAADARAAVDCALAMAAALERLNAGWSARGLPAIGIRIGIHTGPLIVGNVGSQRRMQYSLIGDTANTAARLESYQDEPAPGGDPDHCRILASGATVTRLGDGYATRPIGPLQLKGKRRPVTVHRLLGGALPSGAAAGRARS